MGKILICPLCNKLIGEKEYFYNVSLVRPIYKDNLRILKTKNIQNLCITCFQNKLEVKGDER